MNNPRMKLCNRAAGNDSSCPVCQFVREIKFVSGYPVGVVQVLVLKEINCSELDLVSIDRRDWAYFRGRRVVPKIC